MNYDNYKSVMAEGHSSDTSDRFTFIPTTRVIDIMATQNWFPTKVTEKATRKPEKKGFQTHIVRFRQPQQNQAIVVGDIVRQVTGNVFEQITGMHESNVHTRVSTSTINDVSTTISKHSASVNLDSIESTPKSGIALS